MAFVISQDCASIEASLAETAVLQAVETVSKTLGLHALSVTGPVSKLVLALHPALGPRIHGRRCTNRSSLRQRLPRTFNRLLRKKKKRSCLFYLSVLSQNQLCHMLDPLIVSDNQQLFITTQVRLREVGPDKAPS